jgi:hypothetical protein
MMEMDLLVRARSGHFEQFKSLPYFSLIFFEAVTKGDPGFFSCASLGWISGALDRWMLFWSLDGQSG